MTPVIVFLIGIGIIAVAIGLLALRKGALAQRCSQEHNQEPRRDAWVFGWWRTPGYHRQISYRGGIFCAL